MHVGQLVLDAGLHGEVARRGAFVVVGPVAGVGPVASARSGQRRRGLELRQRLTVTAEHHQHLAQRDPPGQLRIAERQGADQVRVRLGVRVQVPGRLRCTPPPLRGLAVPAGQLQVVGHRRGPGGGRVPLVPPGQDIRRPAVQQPAPGQRRRLVGGPAQCLVGEPVGGGLARGGRRDLGQQRPGQGLVDRLDDLVLAPPADRAQQVGVVVAAEHRGAGQHLPGRLADRLQPGPQ